MQTSRMCQLSAGGHRRRNWVRAWNPQLRDCAISVLLLATCGAVAAAAEPPRPETPDAEQILKDLRPGHPRLIVPPGRIQELVAQVRTDETLKRWHQALQRHAEGILKAPPSKYEIPDGKRLLATSRRVAERVTTLALLHRMEGRRPYAERAWQELETAAGFKDWNPSHFLDTAEMTAAFAVGYDWLYEQWTAEQRKTLRTAIIELGLKPGMAVYRRSVKGGGWPNSPHNWNQVCNGGLTLGALALADEEPELAGAILEHAVRSVPRAMREFAPDGAWAEGPGYWSYATQYNLLMLAALETALGTDYGLSQIPGFSEAGTFPLYMSGPFGTTFCFADAHAGTVRAWQLFWFSRKFNRPEFAAFQTAHATPTALDLVFYDPRGRNYDATRLPLDKHYRAAEIGTFRSDWQDRNAWFVAFKAGANPVNHSHLDLGTFVLDALGERWFVDIGSDNYNLPGYFGRNRWDYYRLRTEGHNTLVINSARGPDQDPRAVTAIDSFQAGAGSAAPAATLDLTAAYARDADKVRRTFSMPGRRALTIRDEISTKAPAAVWSFLHTPAQVELDREQRAATLTIGGKTLLVELVAPPQAVLAVVPAEPLPTSPHPEGQAANRGVRKLAVHLERVTQTTIELRVRPAAPTP